MAIEYTWTIAQCEHEVATGGITVAHWRVSAVDGDYSASAYGSCGFNPDPAAPGLVPYADVTEAEVLAGSGAALIRTRPRPTWPLRSTRRRTRPAKQGFRGRKT
jgi:hypothetical protein